jgi:toxin CcdB
MAQFDVYKNTNIKTKDEIPFLLDIQHNILEDSNTRVMIPLGFQIQINNTINPSFLINEVKVTLMTTFMATMAVEQLGQKVYSLKDKRDDIISSIDFLITGF